MKTLGKAVLIGETMLVIGFLSYVAGATDIAWTLHDSTIAGFNATKYDIERNYTGEFKQFVRRSVFRAVDD